MSIVMERVLLMPAESHLGRCLRNVSGQMDSPNVAIIIVMLMERRVVRISPGRGEESRTGRETGQLIFTLCVCAATLHKNG